MSADRFCDTCGSPMPTEAGSCPVCGAVAAKGAESSAPPALVPIAIAVVGLLIATVAIVIVRQDDGAPSAAGGAGGEVFLEAAADAGPQPFTDAIDPGAPASSVVPAPTGEALAAPAGVVPMSGTAPAPGSPPYGGSGDDQVCDREQLITFLAAQPAQANAWAGVLGVSVADIPTYVRSLTPTVLLYDTRVTNHGFDGSNATPRQSVLQAGTAVLVDGNGDPVVRCRCGNPLAPAQPVPTPTVVGTPWPGFDPTVLVAVNAGVTVTVVIEVPASSTSTTGGVDLSPVDLSPVDLSPDDIALAEGLVATISECVAPGEVRLLDVQTIPGRTGAFTILLDVEGTEMLFTYEPDTGIITEGDRASAQLLADCGIV